MYGHCPFVFQVSKTSVFRTAGVSSLQFKGSPDTPNIMIFMPAISTPGLSVKVATALDVISTLVAGQIGYAFSVPAYHPVIITYAVGVTYALFRWKDEITCELLKVAAPLQNRNRYNYYDKIMVQNLRFKVHMVMSIFQKNKVKERPKEIHLFVENRLN